MDDLLIIIIFYKIKEVGPTGLSRLFFGFFTVK